MARQVLPIVGAIVGGIFGGPVGAQIGFALGSIIGGAIDPQVIKGPKLGDAGLQTSAEGVYRPIVLGTGAVKGNVFERGNRQVKKDRQQQGKGGPVTETERVFWTFAIRICEGPIAGVSRIWMDEKLVYDITPGSGIPEESSDFGDKFRLYLGDETQLPDPDIEDYRGEGNTPAYRGTAYIVFPNFDLTDRRESIPDFRFEVASVRATTTSPIVAGTTAYYSGSVEDLIRTADTTLATGSGGRRQVTMADNGFAATAAVVAPHLRAWTFGVSGWTPGSIVGTAPVAQPQALAFSPDGRWLAVGLAVAPYLMLYARDGTTLTFVTNASGAAAAVRYVTWSKDGSKLGVSIDSSTPIEIYTISGDELLRSQTSETLVGAFSGVNLDFNFSGSLIVYADSNRVSVWDCAYAPIRLLADTPGLTGGGNIRVFWADDSQRFYLVNNVAPYLSVGFVGTIDGEPEVIVVPVAEQPPAVPDGAALSFDYRYLFVAPNGNPLMVYAAAGASLELIAEPGIGEAGDIAVDETYRGAILDPGSVSLGSIVEAIHARCNAVPGNVSELIDEVDGLVLAGDYTGADAIRTLMPVYFFDGPEYDDGAAYRIHYVKRGKPVVRTLTIDDLLEAPEKTVREDALERPRALHLHYENPTIGYAAAKATIRRDSPDAAVVGETSIQVPVSFRDVDEPAQICAKLMKIAWVEVAGETELTVHDGNVDLVPGDCVGLALRGQVHRLRVAQEQIEPGAIRWRLLPDRQSAYSSFVTGVPVPIPTPPLPSLPGQTVYEFLDIPALVDGDDRLGWYEAVSGQTPAWYGAETQRRLAAATEFSTSLRFSQNTIMGTLLEDVSAASEHYPDRTNVVHVRLLMDDDIPSLSDAAFLSEGGAFVLENDDGTWEVLQYRDAIQASDGTFALSTLLRGRLNTGAQAKTAGARFVLLDGARMVEAGSSVLNTVITTRAVSFGTSPDAAAQQANTFTGQSQIEFPVAHLFLARDGDTIGARTVPRHRFGTETNPVRSVNWIGYRWHATDGVNMVSVDTTLETVAFDATGWATPITVTVSQLNRITGPGPAVSEQIA